MRKQTWILTDVEKCADVLAKSNARDNNVFDDNGDWADGSLLAPCIAVERGDGLDDLAATGGAFYTENAHYFGTNDRADMANWLGLDADELQILLDNDDDDGYRNQVSDRARELGYGWTHYGAYGTIDETWVFVK